MLPPPLKRSLLTLALAMSAGPVLAQAASSSAGASALASASAPATTQRTTVEQDNLWDIAGQLAPVLGATRQQVMVAVLRRNPEAFVKGNIHRLRRGVPLVLPGRAEVLSEDRALSVALVADHLKAMRGGQVLAPLPPVSAAAVPGTVPATPAVPPAVPAPASAPPPSAVPSAALPAKVPVPASAAVVAAPAPASAPVAAPASAVEQPVAPASANPPDTRPSDAAVDVPDAASGSSGAVPAVLPWLLGLGAVAGGVILWRRRRVGFLPDAPAQPDFSPTLSATRSGGPRVFDISNAAADVARSVETSRAATQLVRSAQSPADEVDVARIVEQAAIKLEIARASLDVGRTDAARALLQAVVREGSGRHAAEAAEILARLG